MFPHHTSRLPAAPTQHLGPLYETPLWSPQVPEAAADAGDGRSLSTELNSSPELSSGPPVPLAELPPLLDDAEAQPTPQGSGAPEADLGVAVPGEPTEQLAAEPPGVQQGWEPSTSSSQMAGHPARSAWQLPAAPWSSSQELQSSGVALVLSNPAQLPAPTAPLPPSGGCGGQHPGQLPPRCPEQPYSLLSSTGSAGSGGQHLQHAMLPASDGSELAGLGHQQQAMLPCSGSFQLPEAQQQLLGPTFKASAGLVQGLHEHQLAGPSCSEGAGPGQASHEQQLHIPPSSSHGLLLADHGHQSLFLGGRHADNRHHSGQQPVDLPAAQALPQQPISEAGPLHLAIKAAGDRAQPQRAAQAAPAGHGALWEPARAWRPQAHRPRHAEPGHAEHGHVQPSSRESDPDEGAPRTPQSPQSEADLTPNRAAGLERELHQREAALRRWGPVPIIHLCLWSVRSTSASPYPLVLLSASGAPFCLAQAWGPMPHNGASNKFQLPSGSCHQKLHHDSKV